MGRCTCIFVQRHVAHSTLAPPDTHISHFNHFLLRSQLFMFGRDSSATIGFIILIGIAIATYSLKLQFLLDHCALHLQGPLGKYFSRAYHCLHWVNGFYTDYNVLARRITWFQDWMVAARGLHLARLQEGCDQYVPMLHADPVNASAREMKRILTQVGTSGPETTMPKCR